MDEVPFFKFPRTSQDIFAVEAALFIAKKQEKKRFEAFKSAHFEMIRDGVSIRFSCENKTSTYAFYFQRLVGDLGSLGCALVLKLDCHIDLDSYSVSFIDRKKPGQLAQEDILKNALFQKEGCLSPEPIKLPRLTLPGTKEIFTQRYQDAKRAGWNEVLKSSKQWEAFQKKYKDQPFWIMIVEKKFKKGLIGDVYRQKELNDYLHRTSGAAPYQDMKDAFNVVMQEGARGLQRELCMREQEGETSVTAMINRFKEIAKFIFCKKLNPVYGFREKILEVSLLGIECMGIHQMVETIAELEQLKLTR